MQHVGV